MDKFGYKMTMKGSEWKEANGHMTKTFTTKCACVSEAHDINSWIECNKDDVVELHFNQVLKTKWWKRPTTVEWVNSLLNRVTGIWQLASKGYIEVHSDFIISEDNVDGLIAVLREAKREMRCEK